MRTQFQYKLVYRASDHRDVETAFVETDEERVTVRDPRPNKRTLSVVSNLDWATVERALVDLMYEDPENDVFADASFEFNADENASKNFVVDLVNPSRRQIAYQVTILFKNGRLLEVPRSLTNDRRIILRSNMRGHRIITVRPRPVDFASKRLREIQVELRYEDMNEGLSFSELVSLLSRHEQGSFEFDYADDQIAYEYRVTYWYLNGMTRSTGWNIAKATDLFIPVA
ncbi:MAG: hypothetical protein HC827_07240 [Cyanobacteria bacterium RM1_2_2]|nr:hypothetical protein [Cyanobacteria bacterium RM1_2_2]